MVTVQVCVGSACHVKGSYSLLNDLQDLVGEYAVADKVKIKAVFCLGECAKAVAVKFEGEDHVYSLEPKNARSFFQNEVLKRAQA